MSTIKRFRAPLLVMSGAIMTVVAFAGPANAEGSVYPPPHGTQVLGASASRNAPATGATAYKGELAFTGGAVVGIGALGGLLLVGGATMVVAGKRRKVDA